MQRKSSKLLEENIGKSVRSQCTKEFPKQGTKSANHEGKYCQTQFHQN